MKADGQQLRSICMAPSGRRFRRRTPISRPPTPPRAHLHILPPPHFCPPPPPAVPPLPPPPPALGEKPLRLMVEAGGIGEGGQATAGEDMDGVVRQAIPTPHTNFASSHPPPCTPSYPATAPLPPAAASRRAAASTSSACTRLETSKAYGSGRRDR